MSILIKGMEMPEGCGALTLQVWPDGQVEIINCDGKWKVSEAVPIPAHGRLIDADALIRELQISDEDGNNGATLLMAAFLEVLKGAPTVIPAEEGEA